MGRSYMILRRECGTTLCGLHREGSGRPLLWCCNEHDGNGADLMVQSRLLPTGQQLLLHSLHHLVYLSLLSGEQN